MTTARWLLSLVIGLQVAILVMLIVLLGRVDAVDRRVDRGGDVVDEPAPDQ